MIAMLCRQRSIVDAELKVGMMIESFAIALLHSAAVLFGVSVALIDDVEVSPDAISLAECVPDLFMESVGSHES
jgi:hypothetical protein